MVVAFLWPRDLAAPEDATTEAERDPEVQAIVGHLRDVAAPAMEAQNVPRLRQVLAEIALSTAYAEVDVAFNQSAACSMTSFPDPERPFQLSEEVPKRIGIVAAALVVEAFQLFFAARSGYGAERLDSEIEQLYRQLSASDLAEGRRALVLGDIVPPDVSRVILTTLCGTVALVALAGEMFAHRKVPEWRAVALGEIAVDGMKALQVATSIDVQDAARAHASWKDDVLARLESGEVFDVDDQ